MAFTPGLQYRKSKVNQDTSSGSGGGGREQTVPVNPLTYEEDPNSTFRVPLSQVKNPPAGSENRTPYVSGAGVKPSSTSNVVSSSKDSSTSSINPLAKALIRGEVSLADVQSGRARAYNVAISPGVAQVLQRQSVRQDVNAYEVSGVSNVPKPDKTSVDKNVQQNILYNQEVKQNESRKSSRSNNINSSDNSSRKNAVGLFEKEKAFVIKFEEGAKERARRQEAFFTDVVKNSPFRNGQDLNFIERVGVRGLGSPSRLITTYPETALVSLAKGGLFVQGLAIKEYRQSAKEELKAGVGKVIPSLKGTFNLSPEGIVSGVELFAAPSFGNKIVSSSKQIGFVGKTEIPAEAIVEAKVLSGEKTFPSSGKSSPALSSEFKNSIYIKNLGELTGKDLQGGFTASPNKLNIKTGVQAGTSATPGLYIAPSLSAYFLKIKGESGVAPSISLFPRVRTPSANFIETEVGLIPKNIVSSAEIQSGGFIGSGGKQNVRVSNSQRGTALGELNTYFESGNKQSVAKSGKAAITPEFYLGKGEKEALVGVESNLKLSDQFNIGRRIVGNDFDFYTTINGEKVPIRFIKASKSDKGLSIIEKSQSERLFNDVESSTRGVRNDVGVSLFPSSSKLVSGSSSVGFLNVNDVLSSSKTVGSRRSSGGRVGSSSSNFLGVSSSVSSGKSSGCSVGALSSGSLVKSSRSSSIVSSRSLSSGISGLSSGSSVGKVTGGYNLGVKSGVRDSSFSGVGLRRGDSNLFSVDVRSKGKFFTVGEGLNLKDAVKLGQNITGGSSARSFKIRRKSGSNKPLGNIDAGGRYYQKNGVFIEKSKYAINTGGELSQITFKGIDAQRRKNLGVF